MGDSEISHYTYRFGPGNIYKTIKTSLLSLPWIHLFVSKDTIYELINSYSIEERKIIKNCGHEKGSIDQSILLI